MGHGISSSAAAIQVEDTTLPLNPHYTFGAFVTGPCNRLAHAASLAVSESPGKTYNPLFLHGSVGLGKTHLLQAACCKVSAEDPRARIVILSCETFVNHFINAVEKGQLHQFRYRFRHADVLAIDDIQFLRDVHIIPRGKIEFRPLANLPNNHILSFIPPLGNFW